MLYYITRLSLSPVNGVNITPYAALDCCACTVEDAVEMPLVGLATLSVEDETSNGERAFTTTLKARLSCKLSMARLVRSVLIATTADGTRLLIGRGEHPYLRLTQSLATDATDAAYTLIATHALSPLIIVD